MSGSEVHTSDLSEEEFEPRGPNPSRSTRGRWLGSQTDEANDAVFWGDSTWKDENEDEDWQASENENEGDEFDSDFLDDPTESEADTEEDEPRRKRRRMDPRAEEKTRRRLLSGILATKRQSSDAGKELREALLSRVRRAKQIKQMLEKNAVQRAKPPGPAPLTSKKKRSSKPSLDWTQADHLAEYERSVGDCAERCRQRESEAMWKAVVATQPKQAVHLYSGRAEMMISWDSHRLIEEEEARLKAANEPTWAERERQLRDLSIFVDFANSARSSIPDAFVGLTRPQIKPKPICPIMGTPAKYFDPLTKQYYSSLEAFRTIRQSYHAEIDAIASDYLSHIENLLFAHSEEDARLRSISTSVYGLSWSPAGEGESTARYANPMDMQGMMYSGMGASFGQGEMDFTFYGA
ncbi:MAG: hypothetical protein KVP17_004515 [Porospora cf. gigantea B]|uniref:uncharacterized protein n=1 Tax=Porospora cf. gigantea B TaxID=2853592 RepID=UPI003571DA0E|nr:MAG: hypothetical protein KVP17_004515 [Porospora cf. gigantea B]